MADVVISYARKNRERVDTIATQLGEDGFSVWWDRHLKPPSFFAQEIARQITDARGVVVAWSTESRDSPWVWAEADNALNEGKLIQIRIDVVRPPLPFNAFHTLDLSNWRGDRTDPNWGELVATIGNTPTSAMLTAEQGGRRSFVRQVLAPAPSLASVIGATLVVVAAALLCGVSFLLTEYGVVPPGVFPAAVLVAVLLGVPAVCFVVYRAFAIWRTK